MCALMLTVLTEGGVHVEVGQIKLRTNGERRRNNEGVNAEKKNTE